MSIAIAVNKRIWKALATAGLIATIFASAQPGRAAEIDPASLPAAAGRKIDFASDVRPIFAAACVSCHGPEKQKSGYRLDARASAMRGGDLGVRPIVPGNSAQSPLIHYVTGVHPEVTMPPKGERLSAAQVGVLRAWIDQGAIWPADAAGAAIADKTDWWSLKPIAKVTPPAVAAEWAGRVRNPIDHFILSKLREKGLKPASEADRRTLIRRLYFDLIGLPPEPAEVESFVADQSPDAYENLVDRLLASPRYGERWARHWLDAVHYGDTHGYDKDKVRPNAWPYRDYVIRSLNQDKPYARFVREQLAGDHFFPGTTDGITGLGFIAAGPWDFVGHVELREGTLDKSITRNLDRDDMVSVTMNTFASLTAQCARCHNHKFDPITQEDYYSLQAVFAAVDRADRPYESDATVAEKRRELTRRMQELATKRAAIDKTLAAAGDAELKEIDARLAEQKTAKTGERPEFGYHSQISDSADSVKWVQVDLGLSVAVDQVLIVGAHDTFNNIGAGFGFPVRYRVELSDDPEFKTGAIVIGDFTKADVANPGTKPQVIAGGGKAGRYVRVTATKLAPRKGDFIFALAELSVIGPDGSNLALGKTVTALDSIEAPVRWRKSNLVDGYYYGVSKSADPAEIVKLTSRRQELIAQSLDAKTREALTSIERGQAEIASQLAALPAPGVVYAAATSFKSAGGFSATGGKPRPVHLLHRGSEKQPRQEVGPGTISLSYIPELPARFMADGDESKRRAALADWVVDARNPLTWRSIVNRIWQYHFGRGIVETPNDFGHMGALPTHPELLDWLAAEFRDGGPHVQKQSIKSLHRLIVTSAAYRQSSTNDADNARIDGGDQFLWRAPRTRLDAESLRDAVLSAAGKLDLTMGGPGFRGFGFKDDHSPQYKYAEHNPDDPASHRRSVYRFVVRSAPDPFMETLDCADPSQMVATRNQTLTPLQALSLLNNPFMVRMAEHFAARLEAGGGDQRAMIDRACRIAYGRAATDVEREVLTEVARKRGLASACRLIFNSNEFVFVD